MRKITLNEANHLGREEFVTKFGSIYERAPWVAEVASGERPFGSFTDMHGAFRRALREATPERQTALIKAHPDLAGKAATAGDLTPESTREQASAGLDRLSREEYETFTELNDAYKEKFGIPMIFAVREHTKDSILDCAGARLENSPEEEMDRALDEINKIARHRLQEVVEEGARMTEAADTKIVLGQNNYGKTEVRVLKVNRDTDRHEIWDLDVRVALEGDFEAAHVKGDNTGLLATDTMRNTVYALAKDKLTVSIEDFGLALVDHFLKAGPTVTGCWVKISQTHWSRMEVGGEPHEHSFVRGRGQHTAKVWGDESGERRVEAGIGDVHVLKTTESGWEGFLREEFTTLPETNDRILSTIVTSKWEYNTTGSRNVDFDETWRGVMDQVFATFTDHYSPSMQNTLYRMGKAVLERFPEIERIWFSFPNVHYIVYDLERFGIENDREIHHATQDPYGHIEGWVERTG